MALFKIFRGEESELDQVPLHEGYAYFCEDSQKLFIDVASDGEKEQGRLQIRVKDAEFLVYSTDEGEEVFVNPKDIILKKTITTGSMIVGDTENGYKEIHGVGALMAEEDGVPKFGTLTVALGGTGATTKQGARDNLEVYSKAETEKKVADATTNVYYPDAITPDQWVEAGDVGYTYTYTNDKLRCGINGDQPPLITFDKVNQKEYSKIESAEATAGVGIVFTIKEKPTENIKLIVIDLA